MSNALERLGRWIVPRRRGVIAVWVVTVIVVIGVGRLWGGDPVDDFRMPGVESQQAVDLLDEQFPEHAGATATVVFHTEHGTITDPAAARAIADTVGEIRSLDHVASVEDPLTGPRSVTADRTTTLAVVRYDVPAAELGSDALESLVATAPAPTAAGVQVEYGGELPTVFKEHAEGPGEIIGIIAALIVLFVAFRSLVAMVLPVGLALVGVAVGLSLVTLLAAMVAIPSIAPRLAMMIGLGVGIDYALFVLSRHRDQIASGMDPAESIARTNATAGQSVVVAGGTVVVAILGLQFAGIPFVAALGYAASIVVAVAVVAAVTLLPALLATVGDRIRQRATRDAPPTAPTRADRWMRWAYAVAHRPWRAAIAATAVLLILAVPMFSLQLGQADAGSDPTTTTQRRAYDLIADGFGAGFNGPLLVVLDLDGEQARSDIGLVRDAIAADPDVGAVSPPELNRAGDTAVMTVIPKSKPQAQATSDLVHRLRDDVLPTATTQGGVTALVGGPTAGFIDQSDRITARLPWFIAGVVAMAFVLLMMVFRSILVPLKAALLNLLSIGAAYGVVVAVFQWGWGRSLIGLDEAVPIAAFVPMMMFAILFGLSMDYEVFILSRIREEYHRGRNNIDSVVEGLGVTAKVISAAALIMVSVFGGFVSSADPMVKMMGVGLATAVAVDATIVRMVLVPATMTLVGDANWWLPRWLDRVLPRLDLEAPPEYEAVPGSAEASGS